MLSLEESSGDRKYDLHHVDLSLPFPCKAISASVLPHLHPRTARVLCVLARAGYSLLHDSYTLDQAE